MKISEYRKRLEKRAPKAIAAARRKWDYKMIVPVGELVKNLAKHINPKAALAVEGEWLYNGPDIESEIWELLEKVRRITLRERN